MEKTKALEVIYRASKLAHLTYQEHATVQQAYESLKKDLTPKESPKKK